jgi:hypothetical protein
MAKKTIAVCDRCKTKIATHGLYIREAVHFRDANTCTELTQIKENLKLSDQNVRLGPYDLCMDCLKSVLGNLESADPSLPLPGFTYTGDPLDTNTQTPYANITDVRSKNQ